VAMPKEKSKKIYSKQIEKPQAADKAKVMN